MPQLPAALFNTEQIKALEYLTLQDQGISSLELMIRAGDAVFAQLRRRWPEAQEIAVFCGGGNNAGDGYIVATLAVQAGFVVTAYAVVAPEKLRGDAMAAYQLYCDAQGQTKPFMPGQAMAAEVIVDALLGTGLNKPVSDAMAQAVEAINASGIPVIAVDVPSGLNANTGNCMGYAVHADCTLSFIGLKQGLFTGQSADYCGEIAYDSLGAGNQVLQSITPSVWRVSQAYLPPRRQYSHKSHYGHVLLVGGDYGYSGAARLAGEAALRVGAGLVSIATRAEHASLINLGRPELMCHAVNNVSELSVLIKKASVIVIGPGLGQSAWARELFITIMNASHTGVARLPMVVDADALGFLAHARIKNPGWILTPHPGEAARLLHCSNLEIEQDRYRAVTSLQGRYEGIVVLKGSGTLIASGQEVAVSNTGNPGMASGGMGDVLAGVIGGLLAQGCPLKTAAQQGCYLHGWAGDMAAGQWGQRGVLASDLMPYLGQG